MQEWQRAWLAALVDGEGNISLRYAKTRDRALRYLAITIKISMTHLGIIKEIKRVAGCGSMLTLKLRQRRKQQWEWRCTGQEAVSVLRQIQPYLIVKKNLALLTIEAGQIKAANTPKPGQKGFQRRSDDILTRELTIFNNFRAEQEGRAW